MSVTIFMALGYFVRFLEFMILARCILSWLPINLNNPIVAFIYRLTEPMLAPIKRMLYKSPLGGPGMVLDISPIILFFIINGIYVLIGRLMGMM